MSAVRLVLVGGLPGTGKSTLAEELRRKTGWVLLRSDVIRNERISPPTHALTEGGCGAGRYTVELRAQVYSELLRRSDHLLQRGESVILDASWSQEPQRRRAREVAKRTGADLIEVRCDAPRNVTENRIRIRAERGGDPSEATPDIARSMAREAEPWPEATRVDTAGSVEEAFTSVVKAVGPL